jgi:ADP-ribose pyrophosphatase YjhB (NUDIX family)
MTTNDPWSGNVALPGGKQDEQDRGDDYETAVRETREEVGIDLDDSEFMYLGQMDDRKITGKGKVIKGFTMVPHVFLQQPGLQRPKINVETAKVAGCRWVDFSVVNGKNVCSNDTKRNNAAGSFLFPSISLPSTGDVTGTEHLDFILWGLTSAVCSDMLVLGGGECINTPQFKVADALTTGSWYEK